MEKPTCWTGLVWARTNRYRPIAEHSSRSIPEVRVVKWRCPQCGKPHERNDPPCDNCGHHRFERAVVPQAVADDEREQFVWACTACGRHHQRNNPPCSRCGNGTFEKRPLEYDDFEPDETSSYLELAGRFEVGAALVLVLLFAVGVLGFVGVIDIPGLTPQGPPSVADVPGSNDTVAGLSLSDVETSVVDAIDARRTERLDRDSGLDSMATYANQRLVKNEYTDEDRELSREQLGRFDTGCTGSLAVSQASTRSVGTNTTVEPIVTTALAQFLGVETPPTDESIDAIGIDAHAGPDGRVYVLIAYC
jgi:hypothetical protein